MTNPVKKTEEHSLQKEALSALSPKRKTNLDDTKRRYRKALEQLSQL